MRHDTTRRIYGIGPLGSLHGAVAVVAVWCALAAANEQTPANGDLAFPAEPPGLVEIAPLKPFDATESAEAEAAAVLAIWKKIRGDGAGLPNPDELAAMLSKLKAQGFGKERKSLQTHDGPAGERNYRDARSLEPDPAVRLAAHESTAEQVPATNEASRSDKLVALREAARRLDAMAEEFDDLEFYEQADGLRKQAQQMRMQWRQLRGGKPVSSVGSRMYEPPGPK